jgi:hypothetical protein
MKIIKILKRFSQISIASILILSISSCFDDNTLAELDKAIDLLSNESANWRQVVKDLEISTKETIRYDLEDFAKNTIHTAGLEGRCNGKFINEYLSYELLKKRNNLAKEIGVPPRTIPAPKPKICNDVQKIILKGNQPRILFVDLYGYNLNPEEIEIIAELNEKEARKANGRYVRINQNVSGGEFKISLNLGRNGISGNLLRKFNQIILRSNNQTLHSLPVIQEPIEAKEVTISDRRKMSGGYATGTAILYRNGKLVIEGEAIATEKLHGVKARVNVVGVDENGNQILSKDLDIPTACGKLDLACSSRQSGRSVQDISLEIANRVIRLQLHFSER